MPEIPPPPKRGEDFFPFITHQRPDDGGTILVRWSLPGLRAATLRVPASSWLEGEHLRAGDALAATSHPVVLSDGDTDQADQQVSQDHQAEYPGDY